MLMSKLWYNPILRTEVVRQMELDALDQIAARVFEGYVVRKDLARRFKGRYRVPEYVAEFLLGRYCATIDENEIAEGSGSSSCRCVSGRRGLVRGAVRV